MIYQYSAHLAGRICTECLHHFTNVQVILARSYENECTNQPNINQAFKQLTEEEFKQRYEQRLSEGTTDKDGNVGLPIDTGKTDYSGGCLEVIVVLTGLPGRDQKMPTEYYRIAYYDPEWIRTGQGAFHFAELLIPVNIWCAFLRKHALWVICGQVNSCDKPVRPISNVTVKAYDTDWIQDDYLGSDMTDSNGWFLIVYDAEKFRKTPFSPFINIEWTGGPDVYFKIDGVDSEGNPVTLLEEDRSRGRQPDRENVTNCFCTKLCVTTGPTGPGIADSAWTGIGTDFTIPDSTDLNDFDAAGYAGA
ncbi:MAG: transthyretin-like family protein, partial [Gammaproteobacteria bacterium]|nr:transthyretin-like family protein [Gammaproteobacteria bacterium]